MSVTLDRPATLTMRSAARHRLWRGVAQVATYLGLAAALVFFLGPFFWIVTTSLKGNEDFFAYPPVWIPSDPSLKHYTGLFTRSSGLRYFGNALLKSDEKGDRQPRGLQLNEPGRSYAEALGTVFVAAARTLGLESTPAELSIDGVRIKPAHAIEKLRHHGFLLLRLDEFIKF